MILLVVTGLAFGAQYVTPVETAANCQKTAQAFAAPGQNSLLLLRWRGVHRLQPYHRIQAMPGGDHREGFLSED